MSTVNINLSSDTQLNMILGQQDETEVREVVFDFSGWYTTYGSGTISLSVQRSKDQWPYEVELTVDNTNHTATWTITDTDTGYAGVGMVQITYTVGTAKKKSVVYRFTVYRSLGATGNVITPVQLQTWMDEVDQELTDIKQDLQNAGMSEDFKLALHNILEKVAYIDEDGQDYLDALDGAMWPPTNLVSISAVFTQGQNVIYDTDSLDTLKQYLVVTAHYSDSSTATVTAYSLSGTLAAGTSTITVSYMQKTTTFDVLVTPYWDYEWDYTDGTLSAEDGWASTTSGTASSAITDSGLGLTSNSNSYIRFENSNFFVTSGVMEVVINTGNIDAAQQNIRIGLSNGTNGIQIYGTVDPVAGKWFVLSDSTTVFSGATRVGQFENNTDYTFRFYLNGTTADVMVDGEYKVTDVDITTINYASRTCVMSQNAGGKTWYVKSIKFHDSTSGGA